MVVRYVESAKRIAVKSLTFRAIIFVADGIIVYALTGQLQLALTVMLIRNAFAMVLYFVHEEYWNTVQWGFQKKKK